MGLADRQAEFRDLSGLDDFRYIWVLYQDAYTNGTDEDDVIDYIDRAGLEGAGVAVLGDPTELVTGDIPWENRLPGKCVLTPEMEMLYCYSGEDDDEAWDRIIEHAGG